MPIIKIGKVMNIGRNGLKRIGAVALFAVLLDTPFLDQSLHARGTPRQQGATRQSASAQEMADAQKTDSVRREITGNIDLFSAAVQRKDAAALAQFVRDKTAKDLQIRKPNGSLLQFLPLTQPPSQRGVSLQPLTRDLLLEDLSPADKLVSDYVVLGASIHIDKLVVFGDRALVLTTGTGAGTNHDKEMQLDPSHQQHWSSIKYYDCETWVKAQGEWKLQEVYFLAYLPDAWRWHPQSQNGAVKGLPDNPPRVQF